MDNQHHSLHVFAIDIGNTRTSIALVDSSLAACIKKDIIPTTELASRISDIFTGFCGSLKNSCDIKICSVVDGLAEECTDLLENSPETGAISIINHNGKLPFKIDYNPIKNLGKDRIADALFAAHFYPAKNIIIIDAGTAITVDLLTKDRIFRGGVIFPGTDLQLKALAENTSRLPIQREQEIKDFKIPNSTFDAINAGTIFSAAGGVEKSLEKINQHYNDCTILATGGGWKYLENHVNYSCKFIKDLTLIGISLFEQ